ncbi:type I restriction enzyme HsdR N-terminal domain-containing protein [Chitinophaga rhizophila]|uniref:Type I restriction enzyme HsdR N-terminal domain-containing protein n=1 Tax=Chitinophaga rhizophila TaxID=2866212 RepID=A0ABS7G9N6_9BACT|nr:type I restriction enzyme HsdR N-terminal domain-containing protein [Chitinophaga rhizophila]MBW8684382.1 type I restriction enzyme HsdR N-terminal domain-containing protein [Chitinophaga rhizophila]
MITIEFPTPDFKIVKENDKTLVFDRFRKRYVVLTPEEWVRQNFLNYLVKTMSYPASLIGIEKEIYLGELKKRCDIVVYNRTMLPWMIIECKEMDVPLTQSVLEQIVRYHMVLPTSFLVITNGINTFCCEHSEPAQEWQFIGQLPAYL